MQQISDCERELMKIIWGSRGTALYAEIAEYDHHLTVPPGGQGLPEDQQDRAPEQVHGSGAGRGLSGGADGAFCG